MRGKTVFSIFKWAGASVSALLLAGCGPMATLISFTSLYAEPTSGPVAQLRIIANGMVRAVPGKSCIDWRSPGAGIMIAPRKGFANHNGRDLGMPKAIYFSNLVEVSGEFITTELRAVANEPIAFSFDAEGANACHVNFSFVPKPDINYQVLLVNTGSAMAKKQCHVEVSSLLPSADGPDPIPVLIASRVARLCHASDFFSY